MTTPEKHSRLDTFLAAPRRALWRLAMPVMIGLSLQTVYMLADMYFVGQVSSDALTALAFNMPLVFLGIGIVFGLGAGVTSVVARHIGARDKRLADQSAEHGVVLGLLVSATFTAIALFIGDDLLSALGVPPNLLALAWGYFRIIAMGYVFMVMSVFFRSILTGEGDTTTPVLIQGGGTIVNIILDPVFIFTLGLGVEGAALATILSQAAVATVFVYLFFVKEHQYVTFDWSAFRYDRAILAGIFKVGAPASFSFIVMALGGAVFNRILVEYSEQTVAAFQVGSRIDHIFMLPVIAVAAGLMTLVGMFHGAKRGELVRGIIGYAMVCALLTSVVLGTLFFFLAPTLLAAFTDDAAIAQAGTGYLRIGVFAYPFIAVIMLSGRALQGMGQGRPMLVLSLLRVVLISGPLSYLFVFVMEKPVAWVWMAIVIGMALTAALAAVWLRHALALGDGERDALASSNISQTADARAP